MMKPSFSEAVPWATDGASALVCLPWDTLSSLYTRCQKIVTGGALVMFPVERREDATIKKLKELSKAPDMSHTGCKTCHRTASSTAI